MDEKPVRAFLAVDPPEEILREIARAEEKLRRMIHGDIRWVRPEAIHLTLKFFGDIPRAEVETISRAVGPVAASFRSFTLEIGRAGVFPDAKRPRVIWLGLGGETARLAACQKELERSLAQAGYAREEKPFRPHLTLGRVRSQGLKGLAEVLEKKESYGAGAFSARSLGLYRSELTPGGAVYTRLAEYPFGDQAGGKETSS
jgi:2'-5' RNA ligase